MADQSKAAEDDVRDLHKGALANLAGHAARFAQPALLLVAARLYGASDWGLFVAGQAAFQLLAKGALLGFDRGLVFWIPRALRSGESLGLRATIARVLVASAALTALAALAAPLLAAQKGVTWTTWALMAAGLVPLALMELLIHATVGKKRMDVQVKVRDVLVPLATLGLAVALKLGGAGGWGLGVAFALGQWLGFGAALRECRKLFGRAAFEDAAALPDELRRFARPQLGSELALALLYRLDLLVLEAFAPEAVVGAYGVALQFGNTVRSLRGAFDPLVAAVASDIAADGKKERLDEAMSYAARIVVLLQAPVTALFLFLGEPLLHFFGADYVAGYGAVVLMSLGWTVHGVLGLASPVLAGFGQSRALLGSTLFALALQAALLFSLVPTLGMNGAALGLVGSFVAQALLQGALLRKTLGRLPRLALGEPVRIVGLASAVGVGALVAGELAHPGAGPFAATAGFAVVYLPMIVSALRPRSKPELSAEPPLTP